MMKNQRGEIVIATTALLILVGVLGVYVGGSGLRKWIPGLGGKENKTKEVRIVKMERKPIIVTGQDGKKYFLEAIKTEESTQEISEEQKLTLLEKLLVLPKLWLALMVLGIFSPPINLIMGFINRRLASKAKQIVGGVEASLKELESTPEAKEKVLTTLSKKMDSSTKTLVSKLKREL